MADLESLPFHRKYRPNTMMKYIGNAKIKATAMNVMKSGRLPQVVLLHGSSGCGKTSFARLLAKEYSCLNRDENLGACGCCMNCEAIDNYIATGSTDLLMNIKEIDITDQSGKRDLNDVLADMEIPAYGDEWKIYIFDEVHMATAGLQNRLLKIAEEPPEHVLMILCTTNPEKLIETLKNRCQLQLKVTKPTVKELAGLLKYVCECEQVDYDMKGLEFIANRGELTIRTALQNLWQIVTEKGSAKYETAIEVFEEVSDVVIINLFKALKAKDVFRYVTLLYEIKSKMDLQSFLTELKGFVTRGIYTIQGIQQDGVSDRELLVYRDLFGDLSVLQITVLLHRLLSLDTNNLEIELISFGYSGFDINVGDSSSVLSELGLEIPSIEGELAGEVKIANKVIKEKESISYEKGVENAKKQMGTASMDIIMSMGGVIIDE